VKTTRKLDWGNTLFLVGTPVAAAIFTPIHIYLNGLNWKVLIFFFIYSIVTSISITGGYHRLFAHRSYEARWGVKLFYLLFGAASFQNSALKWCSDHRRHHQHVDTETDPYSIQKGFFYAHIGWIFFKEDPRFKNCYAQDLSKDPLVKWQHDHYLAIASLMGFGFPTLIGWALGSPIGGLIFGGLVRTVFTHHCTFLINSFCHMFGNQPYSDKTSARDSFILSIFTYGEGYHNFHHKFQADYRNGIKWYHWDPTKWFIRLMSFLGLTHRLKRAGSEEILKAQLLMAEKTAASTVPATLPTVMSLRIRVEESQERLRRLHAEYKQSKNDFAQNSHERYIRLKAEVKMAKIEFKMAYAQWKTYMKMLRSLKAA
jgi:stearoyl-CoA desaturase (delta-9 desaturase)